MLALAIGFMAVSCKPVGEQHPTSVSVTPSSATITEGETANFSATVLPAEAVYSGITWKSSDVSVASVTNGVVTGVKAGSATITASADGVSGSATVTVTAKMVTVTGVTLDKATLTLTEGDNAQLKATVAPDNAINKSVSWKSSDDMVATVSSDGEVTAVKAGTATITVTTEDGGKTATCVVTVLVNIDVALNGEFSVSATKKVRFSKGNLQARVVGNEAEGYYSWGFAANQYDYIGNTPGNTTISLNRKGAVVDLFGWSTDKYTGGINNLTDVSDYTGNFYDWGKLIGDGSTWRTLSKDEWEYLFEIRANASSLYKYGVTVCGKTNCLIIAPDGYKWTIADSYNASTWSAAEAAGLVCLPAAGCRHGSYVDHVGGYGFYWSSSGYDGGYASHVSFSSRYVYSDQGGCCCDGISVRLITESK